MVVLGSSPFSYADGHRRMRNWQPGIHLDPDEEAIRFARKSGGKKVILGEGPAPEIIRQPALNEPLHPSHLYLPAEGTVLLAAKGVEDEMLDADGHIRIPTDYPCTIHGCDLRWPSAGALAWHVEMDEHVSYAEWEPLPDPEPEDVFEPALTDALALPPGDE